MEENKTMDNEVMELTGDEVVEASSGPDSGAILAAMALGGVCVVAGQAAFKHILKPAGAKAKNWIKQRKAKKQTVDETETVDMICDSVEETEE